MRYGFYLPTRGPLANRRDLSAILDNAERLGFASVMVADHVILPTKISSAYPYTLAGNFLSESECFEQLSMMAFVAGRTERRGERDCEERWNALAPHLPATGALLDVGANFAWFCLRWCSEQPDRTAVAWEADLRSAAVARLVLESNAAERVCLITARADANNLQSFVASDSRFSAALCLSVLHWITDHRAFLRTLGTVAPRILIEHCDPREEGAGIEQVRREIGFIGDYLRALFPKRTVRRLAEWKSHLTDEFPRELWMVEEPDADT